MPQYHLLHAAIYEWFDCSFDHFGRTSTADPWAEGKAWPQTAICGEIFEDNRAAGNVLEDAVEQVFCLACQKFLADRFIEGTCPLCGFADARGDQCDGCGKLLSATELVDPACASAIPAHASALCTRRFRRAYSSPRGVPPPPLNRNRQGGQGRGRRAARCRGAVVEPPLFGPAQDRA